MGRLPKILIVLSVLALAGCGDDGGVTADDAGSSPAVTGEDAANDARQAAEDDAKDLADTLEDTQRSEGGGSAKLVVGDSEWTFDSVLCAFGEEEIGQEGAEFVLSSVQDGLQMYVSIDKFGHSVSLDDIEDFEDPSVSIQSTGEDFIELDGKSLTAATEFRNSAVDEVATVAGTFEGTCP